MLEGNGESHGDYKHHACRRLSRPLQRQAVLPRRWFRKTAQPADGTAKSFFDLYDVDKMPRARRFRHPSKGARRISGNVDLAHTTPTFLSAAIRRRNLPCEMIRAYYASSSFMRRQGRPRSHALERNGLRDNTIIVFFGRSRLSPRRKG